MSARVAVGHSFAAMASGIPARVAWLGLPCLACISRRVIQVSGSSPSFGVLAAGVGQAGAFSELGHGSIEFGSVSVESSSVSVRDDEEPRSSMRCAHVGRSEIAPFRIPPESGKIGEDIGEPARA